MEPNKKKDALGWSYSIPIQPFYDEDIDRSLVNFCKQFDSEVDCFGCGFMLAFFCISSNELSKFQKEYGYFPFDAYLVLWEKYMKSYDITRKVNYNQRNDCLDKLVKLKMISGDGNCYTSINNPFEKLMNRKRNLENLIGDEPSQ